MLNLSVRGLLLLSVMFAMAGCASDKKVVAKFGAPLQGYLDANRFTAFTPPRSGDGSGTIVQFNPKNEESIVYPAAKCFPDAAVPRVENKIALLATEYTLTESNSLELALPQLSKYQVDLTAAIGKNGVKTISVKLLNPVIQRIAKGEARDYVRTLAQEDACVHEIQRDGNLVLHTVLGVRGIEYTFNGEGGTKLALTAEILNTLKASPSVSQQFKGAATMSIAPDSLEKSELMLLGYRAWKASEVPGGMVTKVEFVDLDQQDIATLKK